MVERDASGAAFGKQFKRADKSGAPWAAVVGEQEAAEGVVVLKHLRDSERQDRRLPIAAVVQELWAKIEAARRGGSQTGTRRQRPCPQKTGLAARP